MRDVMPMVYTDIDTPLGCMLAASEGQALIGLWFHDQKHFPSRAGAFIRADDAPLFDALRSVLARYFAGEALRDALALAPQGTAFQQRVWTALRALPCGSTCTYGDLAGRLGMPGAMRAVGAAVGRNPISILIPCHRVVGAGGALTGYAGGLERKRALLALERAAGWRDAHGAPTLGAAAPSDGIDHRVTA